MQRTYQTTSWWAPPDVQTHVVSPVNSMLPSHTIVLPLSDLQAAQSGPGYKLPYLPPSDLSFRAPSISNVCMADRDRQVHRADRRGGLDVAIGSHCTSLYTHRPPKMQTITVLMGGSAAISSGRQPSGASHIGLVLRGISSRLARGCRKAANTCWWGQGRLKWCE